MDGTALSTVGANAATGAQDPTARINAGTTTIDPGKILISGTTTLADWRTGTNSTEINGGAIAANTVTANKMTIGMRGVNPTNIQFEANAGGTLNRVAWNSGVKVNGAWNNTGTIAYVDNAGAAQSRTITSGSTAWTTGTLYIYWVQGATALSSTTNAATARGANNVILATYKGNLALNADYGRTVIDGDEIRTGSIRGVHMITTENIITEQAQVGDATIRSAAIVDVDAGKLRAGSTMSGSILVDGRALAVLGGAQLLDTMADDWVKVAGSGTMEMVGAGAEVTPGSRVLRAMEDGQMHARSPHRVPFDPRKLYKITYSVRRMGAIAGTKGNFMAGVLGMDGDGAGIGYSWLRIVSQATIPVNYTDYAIYIKGAEATPTGAGTIASPRSMTPDTRFLAPSIVFNQVSGTNDGDYRMLLSVASIEVVNEDAGELVNAGTTRIDPGRIRVSGGTTLADWRATGDASRIDGGWLAANTVTAEKLEVGSRNLTLTSLQFQHNTPAVNWIRWGDGNPDNNAGQIRWVNDAGDTVTGQIRGGQVLFNAANGAVMYLYWRKGDNAVTLRNTYDLQTAFDRNNVILATYQGGKLLDADYGRTTIDGTSVTTGTLDARAVDTASFYNVGLSVFGDELRSENFNLANGTGWRITKAGLMNMPNAVIDTLKIADGSVSVQWAANAYTLTVSLSYAARLIVFTSARIMGVSDTHNTEYQLWRKTGTAAEVKIESILFSVDQYTSPYPNIKAITVGAGTHTFRFDFVRQGAGAATIHNVPRLAVFGSYR